VRRLLRDAWALARPYWRSDDRWVGLGLLVAVVALNLGIVYVNVLINKWNATFYNALQDKDSCSPAQCAAAG
jgi:putative ATP-binding cassette transporter